MPFSPRRALAAVITLAGLALAAPAGAQAADCGNADIVPDGSNAAHAAQATLCLLNAERAAHGLAPLSRAGGLDAPSHAFSARMVAEGFFAHVSPDGGTLTDRLVAAGYIERDGDWTVGENIAWGQGPLSTPRSITAAWMNSPGHRANILNSSYEEVGVGIVLGTPGDTSWGATYTTDFGTVAGGAVAASTARGTARAGAARSARTARRAKRCGRGRTAAVRGAKGKRTKTKRARRCAKTASARRARR